MKSSFGFKALSLCALVVGLTMAFGAVAAHAEKGAFWLVNKKTFSEGLLPIIEASTDVKGVLLATVGTTPIDISCSTILLVEAHLVEPLGKLLGKAVFHECDFLSLKEGVATLQKACQPRDKEGHLGLIVSNKVEGLIKLHKEGLIEDTVVEFKPAEGTVFADIFLGEECGFGEHIFVEGVWFVEDCKLLALEDLLEHLVQENKTLTKLKVNGGASTAKIDGSAWVFLGGEHKDMLFAAHPG